jgi:hypothetical protein
MKSSKTVWEKFEIEFALICELSICPLEKIRLENSKLSEKLTNIKNKTNEGKQKIVCLTLTTCEIVGENSRCNYAPVAIENRF